MATLPDFEEMLLQQMNHTAQDLENARIAQDKTNVKGEIEQLRLTIDEGDFYIPVDNLLPGSLGAAVDIAAGGAIFAAGARLDPEGIELTDAIPNEGTMPAAQRGDWFTNAASTVPPGIHSGIGFYNDDSFNSRGVVVRSSGGASSNRVGRILLSADNGDQNLAGLTTAEIHISGTNSGIGYINLIADTYVYDGALRVQNAQGIFNAGMQVNSSIADINAGANIAGGQVLSGGLDITSAGIVNDGGVLVQTGGITVTGGAPSAGIDVQTGGIDVDGGLAVQSGLATFAAGLDVTNTGIILDGGLLVQTGGIRILSGTADFDSHCSVGGTLTVEGSLAFGSGGDHQLTCADFTLANNSTAQYNHGFGGPVRVFTGQVRENTGARWKMTAEGIISAGMSTETDSTAVYFVNLTGSSKIVRGHGYR